MANPTEGIDDEDGETEIEPISTMVDGVDVGSDDPADDESQRGRRHLPPHWKVRNRRSVKGHMMSCHVAQSTQRILEHIAYLALHCWASRHSQGFEDKNLGNSPGLPRQ